MQTHIFCPSCGSKNEFANGRRPNFCSGCGCSLTSLAAFGGRDENTKTNTNTMDVETSVETSSGRGSTQGGFSKADVEIDAPTINDVRVKLGSFANIPPSSSNNSRHSLDTTAKRVNAKKTLEAFKNEAGNKPSVMKDSVAAPSDAGTS